MHRLVDILAHLPEDARIRVALRDGVPLAPPFDEFVVKRLRRHIEFAQRFGANSTRSVRVEGGRVLLYDRDLGEYFVASWTV